MVDRTKEFFNDPVITRGGGTGGNAPTQKTIIGDLTPFLEAFFKDSITQERQAEKDFATAIQLSTEDNAARIIAETPNDALKIKAKGDAWKQGRFDNLPDRFRQSAIARADKLFNIGIAQANSNIRTIERAKAEANDEFLQGNDLALLRSVNREFYNPDLQISNANRDQAEQLELDFRQRLTDRAIDADGNIVIRPEIAEKFITEFNDEAMTARIMGWYERQPDKEAAYMQLLTEGGWEEDFFKPGRTSEDEIKEEDITRVRIMDTLSDPARASVLANVSTQISAKHTLDDRNDREEDKALKISQDKEGARQYDTIFDIQLEGRRLTDLEIQNFSDTFDALMESEDITPTWNRTLKAALLETPEGRPDPIAYDNIARGLEEKKDMSLDIAQAFSTGRISKREADAFRIKQNLNRDVELGLAPGPNRDQINRLGRELDRILTVSNEFADDKAKAEMREVRANANIDFMKLATDPDRVKSFEEIFDDISNSSKPKMKGVMVNSLRRPYSITKANDRINYNDLARSFDVLEKQKDTLSPLAYSVEKENILEWSRMFEAGIIDKRVEDNRRELDEVNRIQSAKVAKQKELAELRKRRDERLGVN